jgi:hypothetical protein
MDTATTLPQKAGTEAKSTSGILCERMKELRSLLLKGENELSELRGEYEVTLVRYLRSICNPNANTRLTVVRYR